MRIITRYISINIIIYISLVILLILGLQLFIEFMREFPHIGTGSYGLLQMLYYVFLMLPSDTYQFFPMASLLGCIIALGLLAAHSELIIMRAAGVSLFNIASAIAKAAIALIIAMLIIGEVLAPIAQKIAIRQRASAISNGQALLTNKQGVWVRNNNNFVHINLVLNNRELRGITRYELDASYKLKTISYAKSGVYQDNKWIFKNIVQTAFLNENTISSIFPQQQWELALSKRLIDIIQIDPDQESLLQLYSYIKHRKQSGLNTGDYEFIFWQRIFCPFATLVMILLAVPFVFGPLRTTTMGLRMLIGVIIGFGFYILNQFVGPMSAVYQVPPALAAILPTMLFAIIGGAFLFKIS